MLRCLSREPESRPTFAQLNIMLLSLHNKFNPVTMKERLTGIIKPKSKRPRCPPDHSQEFFDATGVAPSTPPPKNTSKSSTINPGTTLQ